MFAVWACKQPHARSGGQFPFVKACRVANRLRSRDWRFLSPAQIQRKDPAADTSGLGHLPCPARWRLRGLAATCSATLVPMPQISRSSKPRCLVTDRSACGCGMNGSGFTVPSWRTWSFAGYSAQATPRHSQADQPRSHFRKFVQKIQIVSFSIIC